MVRDVTQTQCRSSADTESSIEREASDQYVKYGRMIYEITPDGRSCFKCANEAAADSADMVAVCVAGGVVVVGVCMMWYVACGVWWFPAISYHSGGSCLM